MRKAWVHRLVAIGTAVGVALAIAAPPAQAGSTKAKAGPTANADGATAALRQAKKTGKPVRVGSATTATDIVTANPDGRLSLTRSLVPQRKHVKGGWVDLDATLAFNADGTVSPKTATNTLVLSGGGNGPLAYMGDRGRSVAIGLPIALPRPALSGDTATYSSVRPGLDLQVRVNKQGGFSEVFVVRDAAAAADPMLRSLTLSMTTDGIALSADADGNIAGIDRTGQAVLTAPVPQMWDSAKSARPTLPDLRSGRALDKATGQPAASDARTPGVAAKRARLGVQLSEKALKLVPDADMVAGRGVTFPLFIDPSFQWTPIYPVRSAWSSVAHKYHASLYWNNTPDPDGHLQVGNSDENGGGIWSHSLLNFTIPWSTLSGAVIDSAVIDMTEVWAWSCTASRVNMYAPATTMTQSNASWDFWAGQSLGSVVAYVDAAKKAGNSTCPAGGVSFNVLSAVNSAVSAHKGTQTFVMTGVNESTDWNSWKEFDLSTVAFTVKYNHAPDTPSAAALTTSPSTSCQASPPNPVGLGDVTLYATVTDADQNILGVQFELWKTAVPGTILASSDPNLLTAASGTPASRIVSKDVLSAAAGGSPTSFSWHVRTTDGAPSNGWSGWSPTCAFTFDPTQPGAPVVPAIADGTATIAQNYTLTVTKATGSPTPGSYLVQVNGGAPVPFAADANGTAVVTFKPTRHTNVLNVTSLSPGGNVGAASQVIFVAQAGPDRPDGDLTGDGVADLLAVGGASNITAGLWLGGGRNTGQVNASMADIGARGIGLGVHDNAHDYDDAIAISGHFFGSGLQDVLVYYPNGYRDPAGANAGGGVILEGYGDGSVLSPIGAATLSAGLFEFGDGSPAQLVNAGNSAGLGQRYADLLGVVNAPTGSYLDYYPNNNTVGGYGGSQDQLSAVTTPAGDMDWPAWTLASAQMSGGTSLFLWNKATGKLYLWKDLSHAIGSPTLNYTAYAIADGTAGHQWNAGVSLRLSAGDLNGDGIADLSAISSTGSVTAYLVSGLSSGAGTATAQPAQALVSASHQWTLADAASGTVATAADTVGTLGLTGSGGAAWNTGDLFSPDVALNGSTAALAAPAKALDTNADFTVDVWVRPAGGGTVMSQDGANTAGFKVYLDTTDNSWRFVMPTSDVASPALDTANSAAGKAQIGVWTHLTATYRAATRMMNLAANGVTIATGTHTASWNATGVFRMGNARTGASSFGGYLNGQVAAVQIWGQAVDLIGASRTLLGDLRADIIRKDNGALFGYYNGGLTAAKGVNFDNPSNGYTLGTGSAAVADSALYFADLNGDGRRDLIRKSPDGYLYVYYNPGVPYNSTATWDFSAAVPASGSGWTMDDNSVYFCDLNGDGRADLIKKLNGILEVYWNLGILSDGRVSWQQYDTTHGFQIGNGWNMPGTSLYFADLNGDRRGDIVYKHSDGVLGAYYNNGVTASNGIAWDYAVGGYQIGSGWSMPDSSLFFADIDGNGKADATRKDSGPLQTYYNTGINANKVVIWDYPVGGYVISPGWDVYPGTSLYIG